MEKSDSDYRAAIARNQYGAGASMMTGESPVEMMLDILFNMVQSFATGVMEGYKAANSKDPKSQGQVSNTQELQQMAQTMTQMMQTIIQMQQAQYTMQSAQRMQPQQEVSQPQQEVSQPQQKVSQPQQEVSQPQQKVSQSQQEMSQSHEMQQSPPIPEIQQEQPLPAQQKVSQDVLIKSIYAENTQDVKKGKTEEKKSGQAESAREGSSQVQQGQKQPQKLSDALKLFQKATKRTGGMKWFSDAEIEKTIDALNRMKDKDGKLPPKAEDFLKSMTSLKEGMQNQKNGSYSKLYVKVYDAATEYKAEAQKSGRNDAAANEVRAMADLVNARLDENQRIYTLRNVVPAMEKLAKKEAKLTESDRVEIEKKKAADRAKQEKMYEKAGKEVNKAREYQKRHAAKKDPLQKSARVM